MNRMNIKMTAKYDERKGGRYFEAETLIQGVYFCVEAFSQTAAIRELKKSVRRSDELSRTTKINHGAF